MSAYAHDFLSASKMQAVDRHLTECVGCREDVDQLESVGALLRKIWPPLTPENLSSRIRRRISQERSRSQRVSWQWRWGNLMAPFALPATAGLLSALLIFGSFIHIFEIPVQAKSGDVPLTLRTPPRLRSSTLADADTGIQCVVVTILIDENGRVADFNIVKAKQITPDQIRYLENLLLFTVFDPATVFGKPTADTVTIALQDGHLKGYSL